MLSVLSMTEGHLEEEEDDEDHHDHDEEDNPHDHLPLSKAELRKSNKPIMEKRRRARINTCLNELKSLILDAMKKDPARHSKLEKADILEMTVKHLQAVQRQQLALAVAHDPAVLTKFRSGFTECAQEVTRYVSRIEGVEGGVRQRLLQHLGQCVSGLSTMTPMSFTAMAGLPLPLAHLQGSTMPPVPPPPLQQSPGDVNNNQARLLHGLVAARLAAAGDAAGAALLLHGGLSLLARAAPHVPPTSQPTAPPPQGAPAAPQPQNIPQPSQVLQPLVVKVNEGASSSGGRPPRPSAFTAVRRASSPPRVPLEVHSQPQDALSSTPKQQVVAPTARRFIGVPESHPEGVVQAQTVAQPVNLTMSAPRDADVRAPLDFSFRKRPVDRPIPTHALAASQSPTSAHPVPHTTSSLTAVKHATTTHLTPPQYVAALTDKYQLTEISQGSENLTNKRPLEEQEASFPRPAKMLKTEHPLPAGPSLTIRLTPPAQSLESSSPSHVTPPQHRSPSSHVTPPQHRSPSLHVTPPQHRSPSLHVTPPQHRSPSSHVTPPQHRPPPSHVTPPQHRSPSSHVAAQSPRSHTSPGTSQTDPATPKEEMTSEDNASPDRPSTSSAQDEKDMWRPW